MQTPDPILGLMDRFTTAINAHDLDAVLALVTEDIVFESTSPPPDGARYQGRAAVAQVWADLLASTPSARFAVEDQPHSVELTRKPWTNTATGVSAALGPTTRLRSHAGTATTIWAWHLLGSGPAGRVTSSR